MFWFQNLPSEPKSYRAFGETGPWPLRNYVIITLTPTKEMLKSTSNSRISFFLIHLKLKWSIRSQKENGEKIGWSVPFWLIFNNRSLSPNGLLGYWLRAHEGERNNCFSKIQLVGQKYRDKTTLASKTRFSRHCFGFQSRRFSLLVGYNI